MGWLSDLGHALDPKNVLEEASRFGQRLAENDPLEGHGPEWTQRYRVHIAQSVVSPFSVAGGYYGGYRQERRAGATSLEARQHQAGNLGVSAAILAVAYGGYSLLGSSSGEGAATGATAKAGTAGSVSGGSVASYGGAAPAASEGFTFAKGVSLGNSIIGGLAVLKGLLLAPVGAGGAPAADGSFYPPGSSGGGAASGDLYGETPAEGGPGLVLYAGAGTAALLLLLALKRRKKG